jgi:uncharacterized protein (DUF1501 family)
MLTRRAALLGLATAVTIGRASLALGTAATERRLVVVLLRGALDGMAAVIPYGDPALAGLRADLLPPPIGVPDGMLELGGFYGLHPALAGLHQLYAQGEALALHAVASDDRSRSHFLAQDTLELGVASHALTSGWLNRAAGLVASHASAEPALAVGGVTPLLLRGPTPVGNWMPASIQAPPADFYAQLMALHARDSLTGPAMAVALKERGFTEAALAGMAPAPNRNGFAALSTAAGKLLAAADGPRFAALELEGWDTHARQQPVLAAALQVLDHGLLALRDGLGEAWARTAVLVVTEFGRTAHSNGSFGTDHGTASVAFVLGGGVAGGQVRADWPGLGPGQLFEHRDLQPTTDLRAIAKGLLAEHVGLPPAALDQVFPGSAGIAPLRGLLRA